MGRARIFLNTISAQKERNIGGAYGTGTSSKSTARVWFDAFLLKILMSIISPMADCLQLSDKNDKISILLSFT